MAAESINVCVRKPSKNKKSGFRLHLIADATYEMPVAFRVEKASNSEQTEKLLEKMEGQF